MAAPGLIVLGWEDISMHRKADQAGLESTEPKRPTPAPAPPPAPAPAPPPAVVTDTYDTAEDFLTALAQVPTSAGVVPPIHEAEVENMLRRACNATGIPVEGLQYIQQRVPLNDVKRTDLMCTVQRVVHPHIAGVIDEYLQKNQPDAEMSAEYAMSPEESLEYAIAVAQDAKGYCEQLDAVKTLNPGFKLLGMDELTRPDGKGKKGLEWDEYIKRFDRLSTFATRCRSTFKIGTQLVDALARFSEKEREMTISLATNLSTNIDPPPSPLTPERVEGELTGEELLDLAEGVFYCRAVVLNRALNADDEVAIVQFTQLLSMVSPDRLQQEIERLITPSVWYFAEVQAMKLADSVFKEIILPHSPLDAFEALAHPDLPDPTLVQRILLANYYGTEKRDYTQVKVEPAFPLAATASLKTGMQLEGEQLKYYHEYSQRWGRHAILQIMLDDLKQIFVRSQIGTEEEASLMDLCDKNDERTINFAKNLGRATAAIKELGLSLDVVEKILGRLPVLQRDEVKLAKILQNDKTELSDAEKSALETTPADEEKCEIEFSAECREFIFMKLTDLLDMKLDEDVFNGKAGLPYDKYMRCDHPSALLFPLCRFYLIDHGHVGERKTTRTSTVNSALAKMRLSPPDSMTSKTHWDDLKSSLLPSPTFIQDRESLSIRGTLVGNQVHAHVKPFMEPLRQDVSKYIVGKTPNMVRHLQPTPLLQLGKEVCSALDQDRTLVALPELYLCFPEQNINLSTREVDQAVLQSNKYSKLSETKEEWVARLPTRAYCILQCDQEDSLYVYDPTMQNEEFGPDHFIFKKKPNETERKKHMAKIQIRPGTVIITRSVCQICRVCKGERGALLYTTLDLSNAPVIPAPTTYVGWKSLSTGLPELQVHEEVVNVRTSRIKNVLMTLRDPFKFIETKWAPYCLPDIPTFLDFLQCMEIHTMREGFRSLPLLRLFEHSAGYFHTLERPMPKIEHRERQQVSPLTIRAFQTLTPEEQRAYLPSEMQTMASLMVEAMTTCSIHTLYDIMHILVEPYENLYTDLQKKMPSLLLDALLTPYECVHVDYQAPGVAEMTVYYNVELYSRYVHIVTYRIEVIGTQDGNRLDVNIQRAQLYLGYVSKERRAGVLVDVAQLIPFETAQRQGATDQGGTNTQPLGALLEESEDKNLGSLHLLPNPILAVQENQPTNMLDPF